MSRISGKVNWAGDNDTIKTKEPIKKETTVISPAKKQKAMEVISKKLEALKTDCDNLYKENPTSELSSAMTLLSSFQFNIDKLKNNK
jgi:hypothetical protein